MESDNRDDYIPGTDLIITNHEQTDGLMKHNDLVLLPQPTVSPNDPLTWSPTRKYVQLALLLIVTGLTAATSNSISSAQDGITNEFPDITDENFTTGDGVLFLGIAWWTLFTAPVVYLWGSRLGYLLAMVISIVGNVWYANCTNVGDVVASQLFVGASESVTEAVVQLNITQVFFQHQANNYIGLYVLCISVGTFLGPFIGSCITDNVGWHWVGYTGACCSGFVLILLLFGLEETYFDRAHFLAQYERAEAENYARYEDNKKPEKLSDSSANSKHKNHDHNVVESCHSNDSQPDIQPEQTMASLRPSIVHEAKEGIADKPRTYWQRIALITPAVNLRGFGFKQYVKRLFLYLQVLAFPPVVYSGLQWGAQDAWLSFYIDVEEVYYYGPPWNYSDMAVGIMNLPCLIGAFIGCVYGAWFSDWFVLWCARRNGGIREAETRLWCLLPVAFISPAGMFMLGIATERGYPWPVSYVGMGLIGFGWGCCGDLSMSYLVDCYPEMVLEGMVGVSLINNNLACIFSFVVDYWMEAIGPQNTFVSVGILEFFFIMLSLPMIYYGKTCRKWTRGMYFRFVEARDSLDRND